MKKQKIPREVERILAEDETIEKSFDLKDCKLYATDMRLLMIQGRTVRDFDYTHISSIAHSSKRYWGLIVVGILIAGAGIAFGQLLNEVGIAIGSIGVGLILIIIGAIAKSEWIKASVVGVNDPINFSGSKQDLDSLLQIIRQKRITKSAVGKTETKVIDIADTIRKLAELRDDGIITQEEFEEKKTKLLRNSS